MKNPTQGLTGSSVGSLVLVVVTCQMCRKRSAHAPMADDSTANEQLRDGTLEIGVLFTLALLVRILAFRAFFE